MAHDLISPERQHLEELVKIGGMFARLDRTLAQRDIAVKVLQEPGRWIARSWERQIQFNASQIKDVTDFDNLVSLNGLNYHELAHIEYTPNILATPIFAQIASNASLKQAFNILEDQRIESLFTSQYLSTVPYFTKTVMEYILAQPDSLQTMFPLCHGRRYLPKKIRKALRKNYKDQMNVRLMSDIIDKYRTLVFPQNARTAVTLIKQFASLLDPDVAKQDPNGHQEHNNLPGSHEATMNPERQEEASRDMKKQDRAQKREEGSDEDGDEEAIGSGKDGEGEEESEGTGSSPVDVDSEGDEEDTDSEGSDKGSGKTPKDATPGTPGTEPGIGTQEELEEAAKDVLEEVANDEGVKTDIRNIQKSVGITPSVLRKSTLITTLNRDVSPDFVLVAKRMEQEFKQVSGDLDPGFNKFRDSGRLNVQRAMHSTDIDQLFDQWDEGKQDAADIEAIVGLDTSGSMDGSIHAASDATWAIKRSIEALSNRTVHQFFFDTNSYYSASSTARALPTIKAFRGAQGGTNPKAFLDDARGIFASSSAKKKLLCIVTDGSWADADICDEAIEALRASGVVVVIFALITHAQEVQMEAILRQQGAISSTYSYDDYVKDVFQHGATVFSKIKSPADMITTTRSVVRTLVRS